MPMKKTVTFLIKCFVVRSKYFVSIFDQTVSGLPLNFKSLFSSGPPARQVLRIKSEPHACWTHTLPWSYKAQAPEKAFK